MQGSSLVTYHDNWQYLSLAILHLWSKIARGSCTFKGKIPDVDGHPQQYFLLLNLLHIFLALLLEAHFPKGIMLKSFPYEMRAIFMKSRTQDIIQHSTLGVQWNTWSCITLKSKIGINWNFGNELVSFEPSDSCNKRCSYIESLNTPLNWMGSINQSIKASWMFQTDCYF